LRKVRRECRSGTKAKRLAKKGYVVPNKPHGRQNDYNGGKGETQTRGGDIAKKRFRR